LFGSVVIVIVVVVDINQYENVCCTVGMIEVDKDLKQYNKQFHID